MPSLSQGEGLPVMIFGQGSLRWLTPRRNLAEEAQGICLVATFLVLMGKRCACSAQDCASSRRPASSCASPERGDRAPVPLQWPVASPA